MRKRPLSAFKWVRSRFWTLWNAKDVKNRATASPNQIVLKRPNRFILQHSFDHIHVAIPPYWSWLKEAPPNIDKICMKKYVHANKLVMCEHASDNGKSGDARPLPMTLCRLDRHLEGLISRSNAPCLMILASLERAENNFQTIPESPKSRP